jgi:hypothetical protein
MTNERMCVCMCMYDVCMYDSGRVTLINLATTDHYQSLVPRSDPTARWYVSSGMSAISHLSACEVSSCFGHK